MNVSQKIWNELKNSVSLTNAQVDEMEHFFRRYETGNIIFPGVIKRKLSIGLKKAYQFLDILEKYNIVEKNYEYYCHDCGKFCDDIYETIGDIPEEMYCEYCNRALNFEQNAVVVYKVLKSE